MDQENKVNNEITICVISEEISIEKIKALQRQFSGRIVVVTTSKRSLKNISGVDIYSFIFTNNFSELRNFSLSKIKTEWVLFLDSDEKMEDDLVLELHKLIQDERVDGYWLARKTFVKPSKYLRHGLFYPDYQLRLFRVRPEYKFVGEIHEVVNIPKAKTRELNLNILHYPNHPKYTKLSDLTNFRLYIDIEVEQILKQKLNSYCLFWHGISKGAVIFLSGYLRGKGFLDGWIGLRAHVIFSLYITLVYLTAAYKKVIN